MPRGDVDDGLDSGGSFGSRWSSPKIIFAQSGALARHLDHIKAVHTSNEGLAAGVVLEVTSVDELRQLGRSQQADLSLNTQDAWEKRYALRRVPAVRDALHQWWSAVLRTLQPGLKEGEGAFVDKETYIRIYHLVCSKLADDDDPYDEAEASQYAEEDWDAESRNGLMTRELFLDAMFHVADLYTDSATAGEYADFLRSLLSSISDPINGVFWHMEEINVRPTTRERNAAAQAIAFDMEATLVAELAAELAAEALEDEARRRARETADHKPEPKPEAADVPAGSIREVHSPHAPQTPNAPQASPAPHAPFQEPTAARAGSSSRDDRSFPGPSGLMGPIPPKLSSPRALQRPSPYVTIRGGGTGLLPREDVSLSPLPEDDGEVGFNMNSLPPPSKSSSSSQAVSGVTRIAGVQMWLANGSRGVAPAAMASWGGKVTNPAIASPSSDEGNGKGVHRGLTESASKVSISNRLTSHASQSTHSLNETTGRVSRSGDATRLSKGANERMNAVFHVGGKKGTTALTTMHEATAHGSHLPCKRDRRGLHSSLGGVGCEEFTKRNQLLSPLPNVPFHARHLHEASTHRRQLHSNLKGVSQDHNASMEPPLQGGEVLPEFFFYRGEKIFPKPSRRDIIRQRRHAQKTRRATVALQTQVRRLIQQAKYGGVRSAIIQLQSSARRAQAQAHLITARAAAIAIQLRMRARLKVQRSGDASPLQSTLARSKALQDVAPEPNARGMGHSATRLAPIGITSHQNNCGDAQSQSSNACMRQETRPDTRQSAHSATSLHSWANSESLSGPEPTSFKPWIVLRSLERPASSVASVGGLSRFADSPAADVPMRRWIRPKTLLAGPIVLEPVHRRGRPASQRAPQRSPGKPVEWSWEADQTARSLEVRIDRDSLTSLSHVACGLLSDTFLAQRPQHLLSEHGVPDYQALAMKTVEITPHTTQSVRKLRPIDELARPSVHSQNARPLFDQLQAVAAVRRSESLPVLIPRQSRGNGDPPGRICKEDFVELGSAIAHSRPDLRRTHARISGSST